MIHTHQDLLYMPHPLFQINYLKKNYSEKILLNLGLL